MVGKFRKKVSPGSVGEVVPCAREMGCMHDA